jgi:hypothetical protein
MVGLEKFVASLWILTTKMFNVTVSWMWERMENKVIAAFFPEDVADMYEYPRKNDQIIYYYYYFNYTLEQILVLPILETTETLLLLLLLMAL